MPATRLIVLIIFCAVSVVGRSAGDSTAQQVFAKVQPSVVVVRTEHGQGSGVVIGENEVATNCHVLEGAEEIIIAYAAAAGAAADKETAASLSHADFDGDVCLLSVPGLAGMATASLRKAKTLAVGEEVFAVGAPQGYEYSISRGIVSQLRSFGGLPPLIQTDVAISPGSSGGGLFDSEGNLVGLTTQSDSEGQNLNFAVPSEWIGDARKNPVSANIVKEGVFDFPFDSYDKAIELRDNEDWQGLLEHCKKWSENDTETYDAWFCLGLAYANTARYQDAIGAYREALRIIPDDAVAWSNLGITYDEVGRYQDAIGAYREALRIDPEDAAAWYNLGYTYYNIERYQDAIGVYREALRIDPEDAAAWNELGNTYDEVGRYQDAIGAYREALRIDPEDAGVWKNLSIVYRIQKRYTDADAARHQYLRLKLLQGE